MEKLVKSKMSMPLNKFVLAFATLIGAFGGFPNPPPMFTALTKSPLVQWLLVFVLVWQGGGSQDMVFSLIVTVLGYILHRVLSNSRSINL